MLLSAIKNIKSKRSSISLPNKQSCSPRLSHWGVPNLPRRVFSLFFAAGQLAEKKGKTNFALNNTNIDVSYRGLHILKVKYGKETYLECLLCVVKW